MLPYDYLAVSSLQVFSEQKISHKAPLTWTQQYPSAAPVTLVSSVSHYPWVSKIYVCK